MSKITAFSMGRKLSNGMVKEMENKGSNATPEASFNGGAWIK
jgi:hypothetical protein